MEKGGEKHYIRWCIWGGGGAGKWYTEKKKSRVEKRKYLHNFLVQYIYG